MCTSRCTEDLFRLHHQTERWFEAYHYRHDKMLYSVEPLVTTSHLHIHHRAIVRSSIYLCEHSHFSYKNLEF